MKGKAPHGFSAAHVLTMDLLLQPPWAHGKFYLECTCRLLPTLLRVSHILVFTNLDSAKHFLLKAHNLLLLLPRLLSRDTQIVSPLTSESVRMSLIKWLSPVVFFIIPSLTPLSFYAIRVQSVSPTGINTPLKQESGLPSQRSTQHINTWSS